MAMCGRFVSITDADGLVRFFTIDDRQTEDLPPNPNVAPTEQVYAVAEHRSRRVLTALRWGLVPHFAEDLKVGARQINARAESVATRPAFRESFAKRRCLLPADGFYEWRRGGEERVPFHVGHADGTPLALAGLWASWRPKDAPEAPWVRTCTVVTTDANADVAPLHDRMPVLLAPGDWDLWLDREVGDTPAVRSLLRPAPDGSLRIRQVSRAVNDARNKELEVLASG